MGILGDWRLYVNTEMWDNQLESGDLPVEEWELDVASPTIAKRLDIVLELDATTATYAQGDVVRLDGYSDLDTAWDNVFIGEIVELILDSGDNTVTLTCYCALWMAAKKAIPETVLTNGTAVREQFCAYNVNSVTLNNANQVAHIPLEACLLREPLILIDTWDMFNNQFVSAMSNNGGIIDRCAASLMWIGSQWEVDWVVVYVDNWNPAGLTGTLECELRSNVSVPFAGGAVTPIGVWPLATPPMGPVPDRYGQQRYYVFFSVAPGALVIPDGWDFVEFKITGVTTPAAEVVIFTCAEGANGAGKMAGNGMGLAWAYTAPGPAISTMGQGAGAGGLQMNIEIWSPDAWSDFPMGERPEVTTKKTSVGYAFDPASKWFGYVVEGDDLYNNTTVTFSKSQLGSIHPLVMNVDIFRRQGFGTLTGLLQAVYDEYVDDLYDARDVSVTDDLDWPDEKTKYTNALAVLRAVCDKSELSLDSYRDSGTGETRLRVRDRPSIGDWGGYAAGKKLLQDLRHGDDDTTFTKRYSQLMSVVYRKDAYKRRDIVIWDYKQKGANNPAYVAGMAGGVAEYNAVCAKEGKGVTTRVEGGAFRADFDDAAGSTAISQCVEREVVTQDGLEREVRVLVEDLDPQCLDLPNECFMLQDSRVGLAYSEWLLCGYNVKCKPSGGSILLDFEQRNQWRRSKHQRKEEYQQEVEAASDITVVEPGEPREVITVAFDISWAGVSCTYNVNSVTKIAVGNSSATNNLCAMDNLLAFKDCIIHDIPGKGKQLIATFEWKDYDKSYGTTTVQEVALMDAATNVVYRRAFKVPTIANWYYHKHVALSPQVKLTVVVFIKA